MGITVGFLISTSTEALSPQIQQMLPASEAGAIGSSLPLTFTCTGVMAAALRDMRALSILPKQSPGTCKNNGTSRQLTGAHRPEGVVDEGVDALGAAALSNAEEAVHAVHVQQHAMRLQVRGPRQRPQQGQQRRRPWPGPLALAVGHLVGRSLQGALQGLLPAGRQLPECMPPLSLILKRMNCKGSGAVGKRRLLWATAGTSGVGMRLSQSAQQGWQRRLTSSVPAGAWTRPPRHRRAGLPGWLLPGRPLCTRTAPRSSAARGRPRLPAPAGRRCAPPLPPPAGLAAPGPFGQSAQYLAQWGQPPPYVLLRTLPKTPVVNVYPL